MSAALTLKRSLSQAFETWQADAAGSKREANQAMAGALTRVHCEQHLSTWLDQFEVRHCATSLEEQLGASNHHRKYSSGESASASCGGHLKAA